MLGGDLKVCGGTDGRWQWWNVLAELVFDGGLSLFFGECGVLLQLYSIWVCIGDKGDQLEEAACPTVAMISRMEVVKMALCCSRTAPATSFG